MTGLKGICDKKDYQDTDKKRYFKNPKIQSIRDSDNAGIPVSPNFLTNLRFHAIIPTKHQAIRPD